VSVVLTVVPTVGEADEIAALLRTEGIDCSYPRPSWYMGSGKGDVGGFEIRVAEPDYERASDLIRSG
jgi:hypothetical protein